MGHRRTETRELEKVCKGGAIWTEGQIWVGVDQTNESESGWRFIEQHSYQKLEVCRNMVCNTSFFYLCAGKGGCMRCTLGEEGVAFVRGYPCEWGLQELGNVRWHLDSICGPRMTEMRHTCHHTLARPHSRHHEPASVLLPMRAWSFSTQSSLKLPLVTALKWQVRRNPSPISGGE